MSEYLCFGMDCPADEVRSILQATDVSEDKLEDIMDCLMSTSNKEGKIDLNEFVGLLTRSQPLIVFTMMENN